MIYKYPLFAVTEIKVSKVHHILSAQLQDGELVIWINTDPKQEQVNITVRAVYTGMQAPEGTYINTVQMKHNIVVHVYARIGH